MELRRYCGIAGDRELSLDDLETLTRSDLGIIDIEYVPDLGKADGIFCLYGESVALRVKQVESQVGQAFTIAHEIQEILDKTFKRLHPRIQDVSKEDPETEDDVFASTLIMGESAFSKYLYDSGFDPIWLCGRYHMSVRYTLMRVIRTLGGQDDSPPFWAIIMRRKRSDGEGSLYTSGSCRHPRFRMRSRGQVPNLLFPKRGQQVNIVGPLKLCIVNKRPLYIDKIVGLDYWNEYCLSAVFRPLESRQEVYAIVILALQRERSRHLDRQILRIKPIRLEESFQLLGVV